jgi:hypothetical protein
LRLGPVSSPTRTVFQNNAIYSHTQQSTHFDNEDGDAMHLRKVEKITSNHTV